MVKSSKVFTVACENYFTWSPHVKLETAWICLKSSYILKSPLKMLGMVSGLNWNLQKDELCIIFYLIWNLIYTLCGKQRKWELVDKLICSCAKLECLKIVVRICFRFTRRTQNSMLSTLDSLQAYKGNRIDLLLMEQLPYLPYFAVEVKFYIQRVLKQIFGEMFEYLLSGGN